MNSRRGGSIALKLVLLLFVASLVVANADVAAFVSHIDAKAVLWIALVQPLVLAALVMAALRLSLLTGVPPAPFKCSFKAVVLAHGFNVFVPGRFSDVLKATYLRDHAGVALSIGLSALFLERVIDVVILGTVAGVSASSFLSENRILLILPVAAAVMFPVLMPRLETRFAKYAWMVPWASVRRFGERFIAHTAHQSRGGAYYRSMGYSLVGWILSMMSVGLLVNALGSTAVDGSGVAVLFVLSTIGGALPLLPGGLGTYEGAVIFVLTRYGYSFEESLFIGLALHISQVVLSLCGALLVISTERMGMASLVREIRDVARSP